MVEERPVALTARRDSYGGSGPTNSMRQRSSKQAILSARSYILAGARQVSISQSQLYSLRKKILGQSPA